MKASVMFLLSLLMACNCERPSHFVWPDAIETEERLIVLILCFDEPKCRVTNTMCGDETTTMDQHEGIPDLVAAGYVSNYNLSVNVVDTKNCLLPHDPVKFTIDSMSYRFERYGSEAVTFDIIPGEKVFVHICPGKNSYVRWTIPCSRNNREMCQTSLVCSQGLIHKQPHSSLVDQNGKSQFSYENDECERILVEDISYECHENQNKFERIELEKHVEQWCKLSYASVTENKYVIKIPHRIGGQVCISYKSNSISRLNRQCSVSQNGVVEFGLPKDTKFLNTICDGDTKKMYIMEAKDISCPMPFMTSKFAKAVCRNAYRPVLFWTSIAWLITGIPLTWMILMAVFKVKTKFYIKKIMRGKNLPCPVCNDTIICDIDAVNHDNCDNSTCPHCRIQFYSVSDMKRHVKGCERRDETISKTKELLLWESEIYQQKNNINRVYKTGKFKVLWFILFATIFFASFTPSFAENRPRHKSCIFHHPSENKRWNCHLCVEEEKNSGRIIHDNSHHQPRQRDQGAPWVAEMPERESDLPDWHKALLEVTKALYIKIEAENVKITERIETATRNSIDNLSDEMINLERRLGNKVDEVIQEERCKSQIKEFDFNVYLPESIQNNHYSALSVHVDTEIKMRMLGNAIRDSFQIKPQSDNAHIVAGQDSLVQVGRDYQHAQGGSGGHSKFGLGSSTNVDVNKEVDKGYDESHSGDGEDFQSIKEEEDEKNNVRGLNVFFNELSKITRNNERRRNKRSLSRLETDRAEVKMSEAKLNRESQEVMFNRSYSFPNPFDFVVSKDREVVIKGQGNRISEHQLSFKTPLTKPKKIKKNNENWFDFHDTHETICEKNCLHEPGTCECMTKGLPRNGKFALPWTTLEANDIHFINNPNMYKEAMTTIDSSDKDHHYLKTNLEGMLDLHEGSHISWKLTNPETEAEPTLSIVIPRITQIYEISFLYLTCEREIETEVKAVCTGTCGDYCKGRVCLGSRIWKWENCRRVWCNPSWCWATNDGCCCCGSNIQCPYNSPVMSVWQTKYLRTEFIMCVFMNDRLQNCRDVSGTSTIDFGEFKVGVSKVLSSNRKLPKIIAGVHVPYKVKGKSDQIMLYDSPKEMYLDPPVCTSSTSCSHGFIGDLQVESMDCLHKVGRHCVEKMESLHASNCSSKVFVSNANTDMHMTCHTAHHHTCEHEGSVKKISFDAFLKQTGKLSEEFNVNKLKISLKDNSMIIYPTPKGDEGTVAFNIEGRGIMVPKKEKIPKIEGVHATSCEGCFLCKKGFTCSLVAELQSPDRSLINIKSMTDEIDFNLSPIDLKKGLNEVKIWGVAYAEVKKVRACLMYGQTCLKEFVAAMNLHEPIGQFIPNFQNVVGEGEDGDSSCSGWGWFGCVGNSITGFFSDIWNNLTKYIWWIIAIVACLVLVFISPYIVMLIRSLYLVFCGRKKGVKYVMKGKHVSDVYRDLSTKMSKSDAAKKKNDDEDLELRELLITSPESLDEA